MICYPWAVCSLSMSVWSFFSFFSHRVILEKCPNFDCSNHSLQIRFLGISHFIITIWVVRALFSDAPESWQFLWYSKENCHMLRFQNYKIIFKYYGKTYLKRILLRTATTKKKIWFKVIFTFLQSSCQWIVFSMNFSM